MHAMLFKVLLLIAACISLVTARDVPENVRTLYESVRARGTCSSRLADGFFATETGPDSASPLPIEEITLADTTRLLLLR